MLANSIGIKDNGKKGSWAIYFGIGKIYWINLRFLLQN